MAKQVVLILVLLLVMASSALSWYPRLQQEMVVTAETTIVGHNRDYITSAGETLMELALRTGIGFNNLAKANPGVDPWSPPKGERLVLPSAALLPEGAGEGITINLAELRLYFIWDEEGVRKVRIYPVGIGREGWNTPLGESHVKLIIENPNWTPPSSVRTEKPELPGVVSPGPDNPLGRFWIGLSAPGVGIHGSNQPMGVGRRVSHGCIRLYSQDIDDLAARVKPGTAVLIVDQPVKSLVREGVLFLEVHGEGEEIRELSLPFGHWDHAAITQVLQEAHGLPVMIPAAK